MLFDRIHWMREIWDEKAYSKLEAEHLEHATQPWQDDNVRIHRLSTEYLPQHNV